MNGIHRNSNPMMIRAHRSQEVVEDSPPVENDYLEPSRKLWVVRDEVFSLETRFTVKEYLGAGAYGVVCSAYERDPDNLVAIKKCKKVLHSKTMAKRMWNLMHVLS